MAEEKVIDPNFPAGCLEYKQLLRDLRKNLGVPNQQIADCIGFSAQSVINWHSLPYVGSNRVSTHLPDDKQHQKIVSFYTELAAEKGVDINADLEKLNTLHQEHVVIELDKRRKNSNVLRVAARLDNAAENLAKTLQGFDPETELTRIIIGRMLKAKSNDCDFRVNTDKGTAEYLALLDSPWVVYDYSAHKSSARNILDFYLNHEKLAFTLAEKQALTQLFFMNCTDGIFGQRKIVYDDDGEDWIEKGESNWCPVIAYKRMLKALMLQAGLTEVEVAGFIEQVRGEYSRKFLQEEGRYANELPEPKEHAKICAAFKTKSCDTELLEIFEKQHKPAYNEKLRQGSVTRKINTQDMPFASRYLLRLLARYKITAGELCEYMGFNRYELTVKLKQSNVGEIFEILSRRQEELPEGLNSEGKRFVLGFSGLSAKREKFIDLAIARSSLRAL